MRSLYRKIHGAGPGGIHCRCCQPCGGLKESRRFLNRRFRHQQKAAIRRDVDYAD